MFAPLAGLLTLLVCPLLLVWAVRQRRWAVAGVSLGVVALPLALSWFFPLRSWLTQDWAAAGTYPGQGLGLAWLSPPLTWLTIGLSSRLLLWALARRRADGWPALLLLLAALAALLHVWPLLSRIWVPLAF